MISRIRSITKVELYLMLTLGVFVMAMGYYFFIIPSGLVTGGATGIAIILTRYFPDIPVSLFSLGLNVIIMTLGFFFLGKKEFVRSAVGSLEFPMFLALFELIIKPPQFSINDMILMALYGGGLVGLGFGIVTRYGGSTGGSDIIIRIVKKYTPLSLAQSLYAVEATIVLAGAITFQSGFSNGIIAALYAVLVIFVSGKVADMIVIGAQQKKAVNIITDHPKEIKAAIFTSLRRGMTEIPSLGGYTESKKTVLILVIQNSEYHIVRKIIQANDPKAFVYVTPASEIHGEWSSKEEVFVKHESNPRTK
ncbi:MAG: YitT family protein [Candidatus Izemoplasmatales bacterium]|jgi:uncharacterized membrane-anchored protein YitT (DUF2179 family)|nr:YitT family protein [bacterium]MDZ4197486.1 YitT family protein [Candidatus Izemoplasmatales bacterium]